MDNGVKVVYIKSTATWRLWNVLSACAEIYVYILTETSYQLSTIITSLNTIITSLA